MIRAIIIDDEAIGVETLKVLLEKYLKTVKVVASATSPEKGIELIEDYKPEIVFLDIGMPRIDGFELLEQLNFRDFKLVFTTAHQEFAFKAIKNKAYDYLLKPIDLDDLKTCMDGILNAGSETKSSVKKESVQIIELSVSDGIIFVKQQEIIRLEAEGNYTTFYLMNNTRHVVSKKIKEFEPLLIPDVFYRCHRSHIVNLQKVTKMVSTNGLFALMSDGSMPEIGRANKKEFLEKLKTGQLF